MIGNTDPWQHARQRYPGCGESFVQRKFGDQYKSNHVFNQWSYLAHKTRWFKNEMEKDIFKNRKDHMEFVNYILEMQDVCLFTHTACQKVLQKRLEM